jgi:hypothetical protein
MWDYVVKKTTEGIPPALLDILTNLPVSKQKRRSNHGEEAVG